MYLLTVRSSVGWWEDIEIQSENVSVINESINRFREDRSGSFIGADVENLETGELIKEISFAEKQSDLPANPTYEECLFYLAQFEPIQEELPEEFTKEELADCI